MDHAVRTYSKSKHTHLTAMHHPSTPSNASPRAAESSRGVCNTAARGSTASHHCEGGSENGRHARVMSHRSVRHFPAAQPCVWSNRRTRMDHAVRTYSKSKHTHLTAMHHPSTPTNASPRAAESSRGV